MIYNKNLMTIIQTMKEHLDNINVEDAKIELRVLEMYLKGVSLGYAQGIKTERDGKLD